MLILCYNGDYTNIDVKHDIILIVNYVTAEGVYTLSNIVGSVEVQGVEISHNRQAKYVSICSSDMGVIDVHYGSEYYTCGDRMVDPGLIVSGSYIVINTNKMSHRRYYRRFCWDGLSDEETNILGCGGYNPVELLSLKIDGFGPLTLPAPIEFRGGVTSVVGPAGGIVVKAVLYALCNDSPAACTQLLINAQTDHYYIKLRFRLDGYVYFVEKYEYRGSSCRVVLCQDDSVEIARGINGVYRRLELMMNFNHIRLCYELGDSILTEVSTRGMVNETLASIDDKIAGIDGILSMIDDILRHEKCQADLEELGREYARVKRDIDAVSSQITRRVHTAEKTHLPQALAGISEINLPDLSADMTEIERIDAVQLYNDIMYARERKRLYDTYQQFLLTERLQKLEAEKMRLKTLIKYLSRGQGCSGGDTIKNNKRILLQKLAELVAKKHTLLGQTVDRRRILHRLANHANWLLDDMVIELVDGDIVVNSTCPFGMLESDMQAIIRLCLRGTLLSVLRSINVLFIEPIDCDIKGISARMKHDFNVVILCDEDTYHADYVINVNADDREDEKITCECGSMIKKASLKAHLASKKHKEYLKA